MEIFRVIRYSIFEKEIVIGVPTPLLYRTIYYVRFSSNIQLNIMTKPLSGWSVMLCSDRKL